MSSEEKRIIDNLNKARQLYMDRHYSRAIKIYRDLAEMLKEDKENLPIIQIELAWSYYYNQNYDKAIEQLKQALGSRDLSLQQRFDCLRIIGFSYHMTDNLNPAKAYLERAMEVDIEERDKRFAYLEMGKILFDEGNIIDARQYLDLADSFFQEDEPEYKTAVAYYLGFTDYFQKKFDEARKHFDFIVETNNDAKTRASGFFGLAHLHYHYQDYYALIDICEKIMRLDNTFYDKETLGYFLCYAYLNLQMWDELEMFLGELEKNYPDGRYRAEYESFRDALLKNKNISQNPNE